MMDKRRRAKEEEEENVHEICLSERAPIEIRAGEREREQKKRTNSVRYKFFN